MPATGKFVSFKGDPYCVCPKCGSHNSPGEERCSSCGADIAREIKSSLIEQAQTKALRADKRKQAIPTIAIFAAIFGLVLGILIDICIRGSGWAPYRYRQAADAALDYGVKFSPYKWSSTSGDLILLTLPEFTNEGVALSFNTLLYNRTDHYCLYLNRNVYAIDDLGVTHTTNQPSLKQEDLVRLPAGKTYLVESQLYPTLSPRAKTLTIYYPEYCGVITDPVVIDLTGQVVSVK